MHHGRGPGPLAMQVTWHVKPWSRVGGAARSYVGEHWQGPTGRAIRIGVKGNVGTPCHDANRLFLFDQGEEWPHLVLGARGDDGRGRRDRGEAPRRRLSDMFVRCHAFRGYNPNYV